MKATKSGRVVRMAFPSNSLTKFCDLRVVASQAPFQTTEGHRPILRIRTELSSGGVTRCGVRDAVGNRNRGWRIEDGGWRRAPSLAAGLAPRVYGRRSMQRSSGLPQI